MSSNTLLDNHLINLKIISKVPANTKVSVIEGNVVKESESVFQPVIRFINGDSRKRTVDVITEIVNATIHSSESMCDSVYLGPLNSRSSKYEFAQFKQLYDSLKSIASALTDSKQGISNISNTYTADDTIVSKLERLTERINSTIDKIQKILALHEDVYTGEKL